jgi:hypothetical protein
MKFTKAVTLNMGQYQSLRLEVSEAESFQHCDEELLCEAMRIDESVAEKMQRMLARNAN